jgi:hypothetical protein
MQPLCLTDKVPDLRVVPGHLQALPLPADSKVLKAYSDNLRELRKRKIYAKVSGLPLADAGKSQADLASYKPMLDFIVFAAGWSRVAQQPPPLERVKTNLEIFHTYVLAKGRPAAEKFFWQNSVHAFRWVSRDAKQPHLA